MAAKPKPKPAAKAAPAAKARTGPLANAKGGTWTGPKGGREGFLKGAKPEVQERYRAGRQVARSGEIAAGGGARPKPKAKAATAAKRPTTLPTGSGAKINDLMTMPVKTPAPPPRSVTSAMAGSGGANINDLMTMPTPPPTVAQSQLEEFRLRFVGANPAARRTAASATKSTKRG